MHTVVKTAPLISILHNRWLEWICCLMEGGWLAPGRRDAQRIRHLILDRAFSPQAPFSGAALGHWPRLGWTRTIGARIRGWEPLSKWVGTEVLACCGGLFALAGGCFLGKLHPAHQPRILFHLVPSVVRISTSPGFCGRWFRPIQQPLGRACPVTTRPLCFQHLTPPKQPGI